MAITALKSLTLTFSKYTAMVWAALKPLGAWGVFAIAGIDGMGVPLPGAVDAVLATYVFNKPSLAGLYVLVASVGSALGCLVLYFIGYQGGEVLLRKRMSPEKFERTRRSFEDHRFLALMLPAILPPPFPFKVFVLSAAVFEMRMTHFLLAIFAGRLVRFGALSLLTIWFGPHIVTFISTTVRAHFGLVLLAIAVLVGLVLLVRRMRRTPQVQAIE
ncbi:MAG TPA: VTT domain-containing protein [Terriglobales bacterium]|nr:VTT domain-containing protein [Terriglobales bacterium]